MREQFEAWLKREWPKALTVKYNSGDYRSDYVQQSWIAWQASREAIPQPGTMSEWPDDNHGEYGRGYNECHKEWEEALGIGPC